MLLSYVRILPRTKVQILNDNPLPAPVLPFSLLTLLTSSLLCSDCTKQSHCASPACLRLPCPHTLFSICVPFRPHFKDGFPKLAVCLPNLKKLGAPAACFPYALHFVMSEKYNSHVLLKKFLFFPDGD